MSGRYVTSRQPPPASTKQRVARGRKDDLILRWLLVVCVISGLADICIHSSMQYGLEQQRKQRVVATSENLAKIPPANQVPKVLPPMDIGNDESNRIKKTLRRAGVIVDDALEAKLPTWSEMTSMYGAQPVIIGLDRCEEFRHSLSKPRDAMIGPAGMFNTGTNFIEQMFHLNCKIPDSTPPSNGMRRNVPWGKHTPASWRLKFDAEVDGGIPHTDTLPVVMVKDPFSWMESMCRHPYSVSWRHTRVHCPNIVTDSSDEVAGIHGQRSPEKSVAVTVRYSKSNSTHHKSLAELWNDWYGAYYEAPWPRLIVRYEDLLFYPEFIVTKACQCAGGKIMFENFKFTTNSNIGENTFYSSLVYHGITCIHLDTLSSNIYSFT